MFCRNNLEIANRDELVKQAVLACTISRLDFGAVDVIYNTHQNKYYVLEVNTAPGLEGQTVTIYANAILQHIEA